MTIKSILFDYGGTIDTNGLHWANVLWDSYQRHEVGVSREDLSAAYSFGERALALNPIIRPHHVFYDVLYLKVEQQFNFLRSNGLAPDESKIESIARDCNAFAHTTVKQAAPVLGRLAQKYPLVMVSNFYGNITSVLTDFGIVNCFQSIVESAVVGVRKPDPQIYRLGVERTGFLPGECVLVGDSYSKDIVPAREVGCRTVWLNVKGWEEAADTQSLKKADIEITDFARVEEAIESLG